MSPPAAILAASLIAMTYGVAGEFAALGVALMVATTCLAPPGAFGRARGASRGGDRPTATPYNH